MLLSNKFSYDNMMALSSIELKSILIELRQLIEAAIFEKQNALPQTSWVENIGAQDNKYIAERNLRQAFYNECENIAKKLNKLGHNLIPIDHDWEADFELSSLSWSTTYDNNPNGLEITFYPNRTNLDWCISSFPMK